MCFVWISEQTAIISLYSIKLSVFITEVESVYCAVPTGSLNQRYSFVLKRLKNMPYASHTPRRKTQDVTKHFARPRVGRTC